MAAGEGGEKGWEREQEGRRKESKRVIGEGEGEEEGWGQIKRDVCGKMIIFGPEYWGWVKTRD